MPDASLVTRLILIAAVGCGGSGAGDTDAASADASAPDAVIVPPCTTPDVVAPILVSAVPEPEAIGTDPATVIRLAVGDGCGVVASTVILTVDGTAVSPVAGGDPREITLEHQPAAPFAKDAVIVVAVHAEDLAGNALDATVRFRVWDDLRLWVALRPGGPPDPDMAGLDSASPDTPSPAQESYPVRTPTAGGQRVVARFTLAGSPDPAGALWDPGSRVVDATLLFCNRNMLAAATTVMAYRLNVPFTPRAATWNQRGAGVAWTGPGADAVAADREGVALASLSWTAGAPGFTPATADVTAPLQAWLDDPGTNHGLVLVGAAQRVDVLSPLSNCLPTISGHRARPLP